MQGNFLRSAVDYAAQAAGAAGQISEVVAERAAAGYQSRFHNWDRTSSVRNRPLRSLDSATDDLLYFPPELVRCYAHPLVLARGQLAQRRLLVHSLYQYLHFTSELEDVTVIPVAMTLSRGRSGLDLPAAACRDAYNIVTDEAWHAQFSFELHRQIAEHTGEETSALREPMFIDRLERIADRLRTHVPAVGRLLFAVVSETLVSALLADIPHDRRLPGAVRETVADHAIDEGRHHVYFRSILDYLWEVMSPAERRSVGPWVPSIILAFLEPDYRAVTDSLTALGLCPEEIEAVLAESFPRTEVLATTAAAARPTIRYFTEIGALDDPATADAFAVFAATGALL